MPSTSSPAAEPPRHVAERRARIGRLDRLANNLDAKFKIPGLGIPVGWDSILGLIPGVGDVVTAGPGAVMLYEAHRMGARKRAMARIGVNTGVDMVLGGVPVIGDAFDLFFKSHRRNIAILKSELERIEQKEETEGKWQSDNDQKTKAATQTGFSERKVSLVNREGQAVRSSATSPAKTN
ncbi:MAG: DUF4112 domain-containing protein [Pseudomonadota bacterium]